MKTLGTAIAVYMILTFAGTALAQPTGLDRVKESVRRGTSTGGDVLSDVKKNVPEEAKPAIQRSREASDMRGKRADEALQDAGSNARVPSEADSKGAVGLDEAERRVKRGTAKSGEVLQEVEAQVPEEAKPAIQRSREASQTGRTRAMEGLERGREAPAGPHFGGGAGVPGGPPAGAGRGRP